MTALEAEVSFSFPSILLTEGTVFKLRASSNLSISGQGVVICHGGLGSSSDPIGVPSCVTRAGALFTVPLAPAPHQHGAPRGLLVSFIL